jgi:hypothetical protein
MMMRTVVTQQQQQQQELEPERIDFWERHPGEGFP